MCVDRQAQRLMEGYSSNSRRSLSAPSGTTPSTATPPEEERSTLPVSLRIAVGRAKVSADNTMCRLTRMSAIVVIENLLLQQLCCALV